MPKRALVQMSVAENLIRLANEFKSGDPLMSAAIRKEFKEQSKNDLTRVVVYLMEVIGSRDEQFKRLETDNKDLREILKLNDINLDEELEKLPDDTSKGTMGTAGTVNGTTALGGQPAVSSTGVHTSSSVDTTGISEEIGNVQA